MNECGGKDSGEGTSVEVYVRARVCVYIYMNIVLFTFKIFSF